MRFPLGPLQRRTLHAGLVWHLGVCGSRPILCCLVSCCLPSWITVSLVVQACTALVSVIHQQAGLPCCLLVFLGPHCLAQQDWRAGCGSSRPVGDAMTLGRSGCLHELELMLMLMHCPPAY